MTTQTSYNYRLVRSESAGVLEGQVRFLLQSGWVLHGTPFYAQGDFIQAMTYAGNITIPE